MLIIAYNLYLNVLEFEKIPRHLSSKIPDFPLFKYFFIMHKKAKTSIFRYWMKLFWHPKNPLSKENSVKPAPLGAGRSFMWIFMIYQKIQRKNIKILLYALRGLL